MRGRLVMIAPRMKPCPTCPQLIPDDKVTCDKCARLTIDPNTNPKRSFPWQASSNIITTLISIAALFVAFWFPYLDKRENHELVARALDPQFQPGTNSNDAVFYVELALINRGNQSEIVRAVNLSLSDLNDSRSSQMAVFPHKLNQRIERGDRHVVRVSISDFRAFESKPKLLTVSVIAMAPDGTDIESSWPVLVCDIATDGRGGMRSPHTNAAQLVTVVSSERLPHQKVPSFGWP